MNLSGGAMHELLSYFAGERKMVRRYALLSIALVAFTFIASQSLVALITFMTPDQPLRISGNTPSNGTRTYTITRSVLDDNLTTGSIGKLNPTRVDPCKN